MKYIIESNDVIGYTPKYAMLFGDGYMIQPLEDLEELNSDYINEHFSDLQDDAYNKGYAQCQDDYSDALKHAKDTAYKKGLHDGESKCGYCNEYQRGLEDAWECMKKIAFLEKPRDMRDFWGHTTFGGILTGYTAAEAIAKLKAYEEKQKAEDEIRVGDEVKWNSDLIVVTRLYEDGGFDWCDGVGKDGRAFHILEKNALKTGRHFDIDKILAEMRT